MIQRRERYRIASFKVTPSAHSLHAYFAHTQEMENIQMPKYEMPEMSEMLTSLFGGGDAKKTTKSSGSKGVVKRK